MAFFSWTRWKRSRAARDEGHTDPTTQKGSEGGAWDRAAHEALYGINLNTGLGDFVLQNVAPSDFIEFGSGLGGLARYIAERTDLAPSYCIEPEVELQGDLGPNVNLLNVDILSDPVPSEIDRRFDMVFSIEVAEHIPRDLHDALFDFLVARAGRMIVFSAARPGQGGHGHIAERPEEEWREEFLRRGCLFDRALTDKARAMSNERNINHRRNVQVFHAPEAASASAGQAVEGITAKATTRIITFCNADYIPVAQNWLKALSALGLEDAATIVSMDDATRDAFRSERIMHRPLVTKGRSFDVLWSHRINVLRELLAEGATVIHSDADAVWVRDPMPDIENCQADAIFTQGTYWPRDVHELRGLVLCCGLFCLRPKPQVFDFLDAVAARMPEDQDDQIAVNKVVSDWIDDWRIEDPYEIPFRDTRFVASRSPITSIGSDSTGREISIAVLPHHAYPRLIDKISAEVVVAHPLSGKSLSEKEACLGDLGLWNL